MCSLSWRTGEKRSFSLQKKAVVTSFLFIIGIVQLLVALFFPLDCGICVLVVSKTEGSINSSLFKNDACCPQGFPWCTSTLSFGEKTPPCREMTATLSVQWWTRLQWTLCLSSIPLEPLPSESYHFLCLPHSHTLTSWHLCSLQTPIPAYSLSFHSSSCHPLGWFHFHCMTLKHLDHLVSVASKAPWGSPLDHLCHSLPQ